MKSKLRARLFCVLVAIGFLAGLLYVFMPRPLEVEIGVVSRGRFLQTVDDDGKTRVRDRFIISAPLTGVLQRVTLEAGDPVVEGDAIAIVAPSVPALLDVRTETTLTERVGAAEAARDRAGAEVQRVQATLKQAGVDYNRARELDKANVISKIELEHARLLVDVTSRELAAAQLEEHAAEHEIAQAKAALERYRQSSRGSRSDAPFDVLSPVSGEVFRVIQESEGPIAVGAPIMEVANPSDLEVVVDVLSTDAVQIKPGADVTLVRWGGPPLNGRVRLVEPSAFTKISALGVEEQRVNVVIDFTSPREEWSNVGDGFKVDARIVVYENDDAIKVPTSALFRNGNEWAAYVVTNGLAQLRKIRIGRRSSTDSEVLAGVHAGDQVVVYPSDAVQDGVRVSARPHV
jgi:HlyD family secretion protein